MTILLLQPSSGPLHWLHASRFLSKIHLVNDLMRKRERTHKLRVRVSQSHAYLRPEEHKLSLGRFVLANKTSNLVERTEVIPLFIVVPFEGSKQSSIYSSAIPSNPTKRLYVLKVCEGLSPEPIRAYSFVPKSSTVVSNY